MTEDKPDLSQIRICPKVILTRCSGAEAEENRVLMINSRTIWKNDSVWNLFEAKSEEAMELLHIFVTEELQNHLVVGTAVGG